MKIDLTRIFLFYISSWVSVLSYTTPPEDLDMSGDDLEYSGSGSGIGVDDVPIDNGAIVTVTNATGNSWTTDAPPVNFAKETTVKAATDASATLASDSLFPVTTLSPRAETSVSEAAPRHTTSVYNFEVMAGKNSSTTQSVDMVEQEDTTTIPVTEKVTTESAMDSTSEFKEVVGTTVSTTEEPTTTALVIVPEEKVTVVTTTTMVEATMDPEEEEGETVSTPVIEFDETTPMPVIEFDETTPMPVIEFDETTPMPAIEFDETTTTPEEVVDFADETPELPTTTTTSAADITSGWGGSDDEGVLNASPTQHTDFNFIEDNIIPDIRRGVEIAKPDDDFAFDNEIGKHKTQHASAENQNILERKEVLAGVIAGGLVGVAFAVMLIALMAYRMKKKDEGSYALDDHKPTNGDYHIVRKQEEFLA